jgi:hypothetical protein
MRWLFNASSCRTHERKKPQYPSPRRLGWALMIFYGIFQLGLCLTVPSLIPETVWFYGVTFGTNWEIPTNPTRLLFPKRSADIHRRDRLSFYQKLLTMLNTWVDLCLLLFYPWTSLQFVLALTVTIKVHKPSKIENFCCCENYKTIFNVS